MVSKMGFQKIVTKNDVGPWVMDMLDASKPLRRGFKWKKDMDIPMKEQVAQHFCTICSDPCYQEILCPFCYESGNRSHIYCSRQCLYENSKSHKGCHHSEAVVKHNDENSVSCLNTVLNRTADDGLYSLVKSPSTSGDDDMHLLKYIIQRDETAIEFMDNIPELKHIRDNSETILSEYTTFIKNEMNRQHSTPWMQSGLSTCGERFRQMHLAVMGRSLPLGMQHFPKTISLFSQMPVLLLTISVMKAQNRVEWHVGFRGYSENCIRCHLPLIVKWFP
eukprot:GHVH01009804.1.p1 GENE.GHVH01009804.1~~GHVH01009804.1.p1  ORF type:complete len:295 (+),score=18.18 GHVH01009804.1:55-885(+)